MKGNWNITSNYCGVNRFYQVYRLRDTNAVDHSGNREYAKGIFETKEEAMVVANKLNDEEQK